MTGMKYVRNTLLFILLVCNWNCSERAKKNENPISIVYEEFGNCVPNGDKESIVKKILRTDNLQIYLKPLIEKSLEIKILKNDFLDEGLKIETNGQKVTLIDSTEVDERTFKLDFSKINCQDEYLSFSV